MERPGPGYASLLAVAVSLEVLAGHAQLAGQCDNERRLDGTPEIVPPVAQLTLGELETTPVSAWWYYVPVSWHF